MSLQSSARALVEAAGYQAELLLRAAAREADAGHLMNAATIYAGVEAWSNAAFEAARQARGAA